METFKRHGHREQFYSGQDPDDQNRGSYQQLYRERKRAEQIIQTLFRITNAVSTTKDLDELYSSIHRILAEIIDLTNFFIAIYYKESGRVSFPYFADQFDSEDIYSDQINEENSLTGSVILGRAPVFFDREELWKRHKENKVVGTIPQVWIGIPLIIEGDVIGVMATQSYDNPDLFDDIDFDTLITVSGQVALAIERKRNEQALVESERRYRKIIETIEDGYYELDLNGNLTLVNQAMCEMLGSPANELLGLNSSSPKGRQSATKKLFQPFENLAGSVKTPETVEMKFVHKDGSSRVVEAVISTIHNEAGEPAGFRGIARDITQRKSEEKSRKLLEEQLQNAHRLESLGTLAGGIAHDFNNLLMGIQGRIAIMQKDMSPGNPHYSQVLSIEEYVKSAAALTSRLLGFARGGKYETRSANLNELIENCIKMFGRTKKEITIHTNFQHDISAVEVDTNQIEQVLINLLVNASQAMDRGGTITIKTREIEVAGEAANLHSLNPGDYIEFSIGDTGKGMDNETMKKIFDPFFTTRSMGGGTGLGLAMVYGIIKNHSGAISVDSELHKGTCFTVLLPSSKQEVVPEVKAALETQTGSETILLVDDEAMIIEVGKEMLSALGYETITASSGVEALRVFENNLDRIDMIIIDMIMPGLSGGELFDKLKAVKSDVVVLLSSGYSVEGEAREILSRGCRGFIQKPFNMSELSGKIREILG